MGNAAARPGLKRPEFVGRNARLLEQRGEQPALHLARMVRNDETRPAGLDQDDMASGLVVNAKAKLPELADELLGLDASQAAGHRGLSRQAGTETRMDSTTSWTSLGTLSPCFFKLAQYDLMASRAMSSASSRVSPWVAQPGSDGTCAMYPPSGAFSYTTVNFKTRVMDKLSVSDKSFKRKGRNVPAPIG